MFLAAPLALLALTALAVPIALHLISRGRFRRIRVGSVRLIAGNETLRGRQFRPTRLLLLAVRCALLAAVALGLAGPRLWVRRSAPASGSGEWVLVDPGLLADRRSLEATNPDPFARLDALVDGGTEARWLAPGVPRVKAAGVPAAATDLWSLLREADRAAPAGTRFHVFALDRIDALRGERPRLSRPVEWTSLPSPGTNRWIERAGISDGGDVVVTIGRSAADRTSFHTLPDGAEDGWSLAGGRLSLERGGRIEQDDVVSLDPPAEPLSAIVAQGEDRTEDAAYVRAGLSAVAGAISTRLTVASVPTGEIPEHCDLLFWLTPEPVSPAALAAASAGAVLVSDATDDGTPCATRAVLPRRSGDRPILIHRCATSSEGEEGAVLWSDGFGAPLLEAERIGDGVWLRFRGRFHPLWSDLPLAAPFPEWLASLVEMRSRHRSAAVPASDLRAADPGQPAPAFAPASASASSLPSAAPENLMWLLAALLLTGERLLSWRSR